MKQSLTIRKVQLVVVTLLQSVFMHAQTLDIEWLHSSGDTGFDRTVGTVLDDTGNAYVLGSFEGSIDIDPGTSVNTVTSFGSTDVYVQKFDSNGDFLWGFSFGGIGFDRPKAITLDEVGNVYIVGGFNDYVDFNPSFGVASLTASGMWDGFVMKVDDNGDFLWVKQIESAGNVVINDVTVDNASDIILTGSFEGTVDLDPSSLNANYTSNGDLDMCIVKLDLNGAYIWGETTGGVGGDGSNNIVTDNLGNIYHSGQFNENVDFSGNGTAILTELGTIGSDGYVRKISSSGDFVWVKQMKGRELVVNSSIVLDDDANVIVLGVFGDTMSIDISGVDSVLISGGLGVRNMYVQKLDSAGEFLWVKQFLGDANNQGFCIESQSNDIYIAGSFTGTTDFDPSNGIQELTSAGSNNGFYLMLNQDGALEWLSQIGGVGSDRAQTINVSSNEKEIYVSGHYASLADFDPGAGISQLTSNGETDAFIMKLNDFAGIFENKQSAIKVYPNPSMGILTIETETNETYKVQVLDNKGCILTSIEGLGAEHKISMEAYDPGIYFIRLSNEKGTIVQKVVKQ